MTSTPAAEYWENRYRENGRSWSGNVNAALEREVSSITPGTALDLGSGEGGDALWLARNGWSVTAVDISPTALAIGAAAARPDDDITWVAADLATWQPPVEFDLVTSCFLHSRVELPRESILRHAARAVAPSGHLLIVGHYGVPHWVDATAQHDHETPLLPGPDEVLNSLFTDNPALHLDDWTVVTKALIERPAHLPDGTVHALSDSVLLLRRMR